MKTCPSLIHRITFLLLCTCLISATSGPALAAVDSVEETKTASIIEWFCRLQFDRAQRNDMESFRDYDVDTFRAVHMDDAVSIFTSGATRFGIDSIMTTLASHFAGREAIWEWSEVTRSVNGCRTAYILYDTVYSIPRINLVIRAKTGVSYTYQGGLWLVVSDQGTLLPNP